MTYTRNAASKRREVTIPYALKSSNHSVARSVTKDITLPVKLRIHNDKGLKRVTDIYNSLIGVIKYCELFSVLNLTKYEIKYTVS